LNFSVYRSIVHLLRSIRIPAQAPRLLLPVAFRDLARITPMNTDTSELWREHEFSVRVKHRSIMETHIVSIFGDSELLEDRVFEDEENRLTKLVFVRADERHETEFNTFGHPLITRHVEPGEQGTYYLKEMCHGALRSEKLTVKTIDGKTVLMREQIFSNGTIQSESETHFAPNGKDPCISSSKAFAKDGHLVREDKVLWHKENRPAVTEVTEFDWTGAPQVSIKTMHNVDGDPLWEERVAVQGRSENKN
jgi:hypothetical protein